MKAVLLAATLTLSFVGMGQDSNEPAPGMKPSWERCTHNGEQRACLTLDQAKFFLRLYVEREAQHEKLRLLSQVLVLREEQLTTLRLSHDKLIEGMEDTKLSLKRVEEFLVKESEPGFDVWTVAGLTIGGVCLGSLVGYVIGSLAN